MRAAHESPSWRNCKVRILIGLLCLASFVPTFAAPVRGQDPFVDAVSSFTPGTSAGFGAEFLPGIVLGPPLGGGEVQGSFDVLTLGIGGSIVLRFDLPVICDGPGADFTVFENAFHSGTVNGPVFAEYGFVAVSQDGVSFVTFPYDAITHAGLAGQQPVLTTPDNGISPLDPTVSGGDAFDLATVGLSWAAYVRITDVAGSIPDPGDLPAVSAPPSAGFDLDAIAALHACVPEPSPSPTPSPTSLPTATATQNPTISSTSPTATATLSATATPTQMTSSTATATVHIPDPSATPTRTPGALSGDLNGDGAVSESDTATLIDEIFGDRPSNRDSRLTTERFADVNRDGRVAAADLTSLMTLRTE